MKGRYITAILVAFAVSFLIGFPDYCHRSLRAQDPPPPPPSSEMCGVWFPFVSNGGGLDTGISVTGNATEGNTDLWLYFYGLDGSYQGTREVIHLAEGEHSEWAETISVIKPGFVGAVLVVTEMTEVRAAGFIWDGDWTGALTSTPAVIDYNISGVDASHRVTGWTEPEESRTTLVFPYIVNENGYDTLFAIGGPYYDSCSNCTATLYLYDTAGVLRRKVVVNMDPATGGSVHATYTGFLSQIAFGDPRGGMVTAYEDYNGGFSQEHPAKGFMIAAFNFPYAQGCEFFSLPNTDIATGLAATVDNDIYVNAETGKPTRSEWSGEHTAIVLPFIHTSASDVTLLTLANTCNDGSPIYADIYLFDMDGNILPIGEETDYFPVTLAPGGSDAMPEMYTFLFTASELGDFMGWMLILVDAPGSYAVACNGNAYNALMSSIGQNDDDIIGVDEHGIIRETPISIDTVEAVAIPHFASFTPFGTFVNVFSTAGWYAGGSGEPFPYMILPYKYDGVTLTEIGPVVLDWPCPFVLSASGLQQVPDGGSPPTFGNCVALGPPNLTAMGILFNANDIEGFAGIPLFANELGDVELIGDDKIEKDSTKSFVIKYNRKPMDVGNIILKITTKPDEPGALGDAKFENDAYVMVIPASANDEKYKIFWIKGITVSKDNVRDLVVKPLNMQLEKIGNSIEFRVIDRDKIFEKMEFDVEWQGEVRAPAVEDRDPRRVVGQDYAALEPYLKYPQGLPPPPPDNTFHWNPSVKLRINDPNLTQQQKNERAAKYIAGFLQNVVEDRFEADYEAADGAKVTLAFVFPYYPILDVAVHRLGRDWERPPLFVMPVPFKEEGKVTELGGINDSPQWGNWSKFEHKWTTEENGVKVEHTGQLKALRHICHFKSWVVVRYNDTDDKWNWGCIKPVHCVKWSLQYNATVDAVNKTVTKGNPCRPQIDDANADKTAKMVTVGLLAREDNLHFVDRPR